MIDSEKKTADDYWALPEDAHTELIDGKLWEKETPDRLHQEILMETLVAFSNYFSEQGLPRRAYLGPLAVNLFADESTFVEPDLSVICDHDKLSDRGCEGAPDLIVEVVSPSSRKMDYGTKQSLYGEAGVREYWIVDPSMSRTTVTRFEVDPAPVIYPFTAPVPAGMFPGLLVNFGEIVAGA